MTVSIILISCASNEEKKVEEPPKEIYKHYYQGKVQGEFEVKNGKKEGLGKVYYLNGKLSTTCNYTNGRKNGEEKMYHYDGSVYRTRQYTNGVLNGTEKRFYRNGQLRTVLHFKENMPAKGIQEYNEKGILKTAYPKLLHKIVYDRDYEKQKLLLLYFSDHHKNVVYYRGNLLEGKYFNRKETPIGNKKGVGEIALYPEFKGEINVSAKYITSNRAPYVVEKRIFVE